MKESDLIYENDKAWVFSDKKKKQYTVFKQGLTHSTSDSAYAFNDDGLSIAIARAKYLGNQLT